MAFFPTGKRTALDSDQYVYQPPDPKTRLDRHTSGTALKTERDLQNHDIKVVFFSRSGLQTAPAPWFERRLGRESVGPWIWIHVWGSSQAGDADVDLADE